MPRFEEHDGKLFLMLEKPEPLKPDRDKPCLIWLTQDDSPMGEYNKSVVPKLLKLYDIPAGTDILPRLYVAMPGQDYIKTDIGEAYYSRFEVVGYAVDEGSAICAGYLMLQGNKVRRKCWNNPGDKTSYYCLEDGLVWSNTGGDYGNLNDWINGMVDTDCDSDWIIHEEPKVKKSQPKFTGIKVEDWVELEGSIQAQVIHADEYEFATGRDSRYDYNGISRESPPHRNAVRILSPSEVVVDFGAFSGRVILGYDYSVLVFSDAHNNTKSIPIASVNLSALKGDTRKRVESLLKAQEEE